MRRSDRRGLLRVFLTDGEGVVAQQLFPSLDAAARFLERAAERGVIVLGRAFLTDPVSPDDVFVFAAPWTSVQQVDVLPDDDEGVGR